jgi:hypothetical protein
MRNVLTAAESTSLLSEEQFVGQSSVFALAVLRLYIGAACPNV